MNGLNLRLRRLFTNAKCVIVAMDHGMFDGPIAGMEDIGALPEKILPDIDGVLMSVGTLKHIGDKIVRDRKSPLIITRINWATTCCFNWRYTQAETVEAFSPEQAFALGSDVVLISLTLQTGSENRDAENVRIFAKLCNEAHRLGMPVIGEYFPADEAKLSAEQMRDEIRIGCRILAELNTDVIKTFHTIDFEETVAGCAAPILTLGGSKYPNEIDALKAAQQQMEDGAAGVVFGRNAIQAKDPIAFQKALVDIVRNGLSSADAAKKYNIT